MTERGHNSFTPQLLLQMQNLPTSNATNLPSSCDEELADEADEPPDNYSRKRRSFVSDGEFTKHAVHHQPNTISLLTRALLINPGLESTEPTEHIYSYSLKRGMSTDSTWSNPSTMELTSDGGMTSPSRANTPSPPPPPTFLGGLGGLLHNEKDLLSKVPNRVEVVGETDIVEGLGRKRCITFACQDKPATSRRPVSPMKPSTPPNPETTADITPVRRSCALKFVCTQRRDTSDSHSSPQRPASGPKKLPSMGGCRDSQITVTATTTETTPKGTTTAPASMATQTSVFPDKFYEFASSVDDKSDSWTHQPFDRSRLLKVDDLLKKELDIRKLSQEAEEEALQEEEEEQDLEDADGDEDEDEVEGVDGDDEDDEEEEDQDYDYEEEEDDALSGNESDNEAGFASDSDDDDDPFFTYGPMLPITGAISRPVCCRTESTSSIESLRRLQARPSLRPRTPDLPDSTDFVCGTLDEDKPLEEAYVSCMEERKRSKHIITPQDIDPSFPSDPENSDDEGNKNVSESEDGFHFVKPNWSGSSFEGTRKRGRRRNDTITQKILGASPKGKARAHSPAPIRRINTSPRPVARRTMSPPPFNRTKHRSQMFQPRPGIFRTKSLPRTPSFFGRKTGRIHSASSSPKTSAVSPVVRRGAIDIVKGMEKRRERRKARLCKAREGVDCRAGQGVEKMRELGLEICGKGKGRTKAQWVLSA